jgi:hypothetical protein
MLTVALLRDYIDTGHYPAAEGFDEAQPDSFRYAIKSDQSSDVRASLRRLVKAELLAESIGLGERGGEARVYEPAGVFD